MTSKKIKICLADNCNNAQTTGGYCRLHYLKNWKDIKEEQQRKAADRLNKYVDGICKKNPDDFMSVVKKNIKDERGLESTVDTLYPEDEMTAAFSDLEQDEASLDKILSQIRIHDKF